MPYYSSQIAKSKLLIGTICSMLLISLYAVAEDNVPDPGQPGPYAVGHILYVFNDASRQITGGLPRPVPVYLFYPVDPTSISESTEEARYPLDPLHPFNPNLLSLSDEWEQQGIDRAYRNVEPSSDGPFPLVMVSHGWHGHAWTMLYIGTRLASHGFVVALVYHYGDAYWPWERPDLEGLAVGLINRPLDVAFALTRLLAINEIPEAILHNLINPDKIAASGHSFGGYVAAALAAGDDLACDNAGPDAPPETCIPVPADPRIRAIVPLDGAHQFLKFSEMARISVPTMGIGETWEAIPALGLPSSWQARLHAASQGHPNYRVDIIGTDHSSFSNMCEALPVLQSHLPDIDFSAQQDLFCSAPLPAQEAKRLITKYMVAFLKTNLADEPGYQSILTPGYALKNESMIEFFETEKRNPQAIDKDWPNDFIYFTHQPGSEKAKALRDPVDIPPMPQAGFELNLEWSE
jgi:predicted dienelactone hydrolase